MEDGILEAKGWQGGWLQRPSSQVGQMMTYNKNVLRTTKSCWITISSTKESLLDDLAFKRSEKNIRLAVLVVYRKPSRTTIISADLREYIYIRGMRWSNQGKPLVLKLPRAKI